MSVISVQTKKFGDLGTILTAGDDSLLLIHDGTGVKTISTANFKKDLKEYMEGVNTILEQLTYDNAGAHNSIYRGKNLGTTVTEEQWEAISSGTFTDLYIGDYWVIGGVNWRIAAFDYYLNCGDTSFTKHHAVIVPDTCLYNAQMNTTNVTTGAYSLTETGRVIHKINPKRLTAMRRKLKKLAGRLPEKEFYNLYHSWMENHYRIMSRQQRANMNDLYNKLKEEHYHVQTDFG